MEIKGSDFMARATETKGQEGSAPGAGRGQDAPADNTPATVLDLAKTQTPEGLAALSRNLAEAAMRTNNVFATAFHDQSASAFTERPDPFNVQGALGATWTRLANQPETLREAHANLWKRYGEIWERQAVAMMAAAAGAPSAESDTPRDKRFRDLEWRTNPGFSLMRETYLATAEWITGLVESAEGLDEATKRKASFFIKQAVDAASPSNFLMTNPAALRAMLKTQGQSVLAGVQNFAEDLKRGHGALSIRQTDLDAFEVGRNIATTPGKVVFRNRLIELLQYTPTTDQTFTTPLLIFPPWINKFYIMDLQPKNSLIAWLVGQGHTVFVASWVNPDEELAELGFEDYMREGVFAAVEAVLRATGAEKTNAVGYCIGGTLLAATLAYMAAKKDDRIASATFFAAQTDFKKAGELLVFTDDEGISYVEERIKAHGGFLDAQAMADTFNALRANDLVWNYVVDNYYLGEAPKPFDLLYWNSDQTRMPRALHMFYLTRMYRDNALADGRLVLMGEEIHLGNVKVPVYMQSSKEDHIAPYQSVFRGAQLFGGPVTYMMAGSGHIAGVINPPAAKKYQYWSNPALPETWEEWFEGATETPGSWWPNWHEWLARISGPMVPARTPGDGLEVLGDAPGTYVKIKSA